MRKNIIVIVMVLISTFILTACQPGVSHSLMNSENETIETSKVETREMVTVTFPEEDYFCATGYYTRPADMKDYPSFPIEPENSAEIQQEDDLVETSITLFPNQDTFFYRNSSFFNGEKVGICYAKTTSKGDAFVNYSVKRQEITEFFWNINPVITEKDTILSEEENKKVADDFLSSVMDKDELALYDRTFKVSDISNNVYMDCGARTLHGYMTDDFYNLFLLKDGKVFSFSWSSGGWLKKIESYLTKDLLDSAKQKLLDEYCSNGNSEDELRYCRIRKDYLGNVYLSATFKAKANFGTLFTLDYLLFTIKDANL